MIKKISCVFILVLLVACQSTSQYARRNRTASQYYMTSGVEKFYQSDIPEWANFSEAGQCQRSQKIRFVKLGDLMKTQNFDYSSAIQFQYLVNKQRAEKIKSYKSSYLLQKDEEILFYDSLDKINNNIRPFVTPKFNRVHLVWIDSYLSQPNGMDQLVGLMKKKIMTKGHPVFVSLCYDREMIKELIASEKSFPLSIRIIPAEMTSVFNEKGETTFHQAINFDHFFRKNQEVHVFANGKELPKGFKGNFKINK